MPIVSYTESMSTLTTTPADLQPSAHLTRWRSALLWGIGAALAQRILLGLWMAAVWLVGGRFFSDSADLHTAAGAALPVLQGSEDIIFGVWRRWDAIHYFRIAQYGYTPEMIDLTVFPPLLPLGVRTLDTFLPGGLDLAGMVFATLSTALLFTVLFRLCETYFGDQELAKYAVVTMALFPLGHFLAAPMPDGISLALSVATLYLTHRQKYWLAGICGALAGLARTQGMLMLIPALLILIENHWRSDTSLIRNLRTIAAKAIPLALIPAGALGFMLYRWAAGFPSMDVIYRDYSFSFFTNPVNGYLINFRHYLSIFPASLIEPNFWALALVPLAIVALFRSRLLCRPALVAYTVILYGLFLSSVNYKWGTNEVWTTQSLGRYSLALFPIALLAADRIRSAGKIKRLVAFGVLIFVTLALSARHTLGLLGA